MTGAQRELERLRERFIALGASLRGVVLGECAQLVVRGSRERILGHAGLRGWARARGAQD